QETVGPFGRGLPSKGGEAMEPLRVALIGAGGIAQAHLEAYQKVPEATVVAVVDIVEERARRTAERWNIPKWFTDYRQALKENEVEAVDICTPHNVHAPPALEALKSGRSVLVEKPMTARLADAVQMVRLARQKNLTLFCGIASRWSPYVQQVKAFLQEKPLGDLYYAEMVVHRRRGIPGPTFTRKDTAGGGAVLDIGVYAVDTLLFYLGFPKPLTCTATIGGYLGTNPEAVVKNGWFWNTEQFEVEDFGVAFLQFEGGISATVKITWAAHIDSMGQSFLLGTKGGLCLSHPPVWYHDYGGYMVQTTLPPIESHDTFAEEIRHFVRAVRTGEPPPVQPEEALMVQSILEAIYQSAQKRRQVVVKWPIPI
ncbi:MAG: Gfo/Idh/MocA family oxidoreductase, partial [Armatimonadetes bacterium]|nr:Gfo/Idh/MocA family oxidoreductase [Armatimonadota bacterium]MDW8122347.1 Gfo/Idh/MocA family oxidoreductase [Armatimonadota bacterium]